MAISATSKLGASNSLTKQRTAESILEFCKKIQKKLYKIYNMGMQHWKWIYIILDKKEKKTKK